MAVPKEVKSAISQRVAQRAMVTKSISKLRDYLQTTNPDKAQVQVLLSVLEMKMEILSDHDKLVTTAITSAYIDDQDDDLLAAKLSDDALQVEEYLDAFMEMKCRAKQFLEGGLERTNTASGTSNSSTTSAELGSSSFPQHGLPPTAFHVPEYKLPAFDGSDLLKFPGWFDNFKAVIDQSPYLSSVQKFAHLKGALRGMPKDLVDGLLTTESNYQKAMELLEDSYGDPNLLLGLFVSKLHSYRPVVDARNATLQDLVYGFERSFNEIRNLIVKLLPSSFEASADNENGLAWMIVSYFLAPHLISLLPYDSQMKWFDKAVDPNQRFNFSKLLEHMKNELKGRQTVAMLSTSKGPPINSKPTFDNQRKPRAGTSAFSGPSSPQACSFCNDADHTKLFKCSKFRNSSVSDRIKHVRQNQLCENCLGSRHATDTCYSKFRCLQCQARHHSLLCSVNKGPSSDKKDTNKTLLEEIVESPVLTSALPGVASNKTVVQVVPITVSDPSGQRKIETYGLFDSGAGHTWLRADLARQLELKSVAKQAFRVDSFNEGKSIINSQQVICDVQGKGSSCMPRISIRPWTANKLTCSLSQSIGGPLPSHLAPLDVFEAYDGRKVEVGLIIGVDYYHDLMTPELVRGNPTAQRTLLGWTLSGRAPSSTGTTTSLSLFTSIRPEDAWDLNTIGIYDDPNALIDPYAEPRIVEGRYEVRLPFKSDHRPASNYTQAMKRYQVMSGKQTPQQKQEYDDNLLDAFHKGYIERVDHPDPNQGFFLPHRGEYGKKKLRIVFDGSASDPNGVSLNSVLDPGPNMLSLLVDVFQRFRLRKWPLVGDIVGAFHQLSLPPEDRIWVQFLWKNKVFRFSRVPFGLACSPFLLLRTLHHHYLQLPRALGEFLSLSTYMDDITNSLDSECERDDLFESAKSSFSTVGMTLRIPDSQSLLGVGWDRTSDLLSLDLSAIRHPTVYTRRTLLQMIAGVFDPCGLMSPYLIRGRMLLQRAWKLGTKWDDILPNDLQDDWNSWITDRSSISVPRWLGYTTGDHLEYHLFCDASSTAYAAVLYGVLPEKGISSLIVSKARVTPLKTPITSDLTIPRAELMGLTIGVRLLRNTCDQLIKPNKVVIWTDATTVMNWLSEGKQHKMIFVRNRVAEIQKNLDGLPDVEVRYVPTDLNPADLPSRGCKADLLQESFWLNGPPFLLQCKSTWPSSHILTSLSVRDIPVEPPSSIPAINIENFSALGPLLRVTSWIRRFIHNRFVSQDKQQPRITGPLTTDEINDAWVCLVRTEQKKAYPEEWNSLKAGKNILRSSPLLKLQPFFDSKLGLMQLLPRTGEPPIILLPSKSYLTYLYVMEVHQKSYHPGGHGTLAEVRRSCWIPNGLSTVKKYLLECRACPRFKSPTCRLQEGQLPSFRTTPAPPFSTVGVDHFGPMLLSSGLKVWVIIFTCPVTRAVHLELCKNYSAKEARLRFRQFLALRVPCHQVVNVYSDNSKTFKKVSTMKFPSHQLRWKFIPEYTPNFGGWWERLIRSIKTALRITFHGVSFRRDILQVSLHEVAAMINRRPLTATSTDPSDESPITPAHFLYGCPPPGYLMPGANKEPRLDLENYASGRRHFSESFWKIWSKNYLQSLQTWSKNSSSSSYLPKVGSIVLIRENSPRGIWPMARVSRVLPDRYGNPRVASLYLGGRTVRRSFRDLVPLEDSTPSLQPGTGPASCTRTRSGRVIKPVNRLVV